MPAEAQLSHRTIKTANIPYVSNLSPTSTDPCYITGSADILTSINGYATRRPGWGAVVEGSATTFNNIQRIFTWDRTDGTFYLMLCDVNASSQAVVYKFQFGVDTSAVSLFTDTTSANPFDFVVSNNTVYFANGHVAKKWDPVNGVTNWGIAIGSVNNATGPNTAGAGATAGSGTAWTNPGNVTSAVSDATVSLGAHAGSQNLQATTFAFSLPATNTVTGIQVDVVSSENVFDGFVTAQLLKGGTATGSIKTIPQTITAGTNFTLGGTSDLWGASWVSNDINQTTFGVQFVATAISGMTARIRNVRITIYGLGGPSISVSGSAGTFSATVGYQYVFTYGNSNTGHISSPSPPSSSTGVFTSKLNVQVSLTASTDTQVNQIHVYRSTDSVAPNTTAATYFELPSSPYPNTTANITDNAADSALIVASIAPTPTFNDPPTPVQSVVYFSGRIWGFAGNKVWFSGLEEIISGVPEEAWPSGVAGNFWGFDQPVQALSVAGSGNDQTLIVFCGGRVFGITGNTLDTFRRYVISSRRGCRNIKAVSSMGGMVAWRDTSGQVWATDGNNMQELGIDIRPDLTPYTPGGDCVMFHANGNQHWLLVSTGSKVFVYDLDTEQWMPPWTHSTQILYSGESAAGTYQLFSGDATQLLTQLTASTYQDLNVSQAAVTYQPIFKLSHMALVPDFGTRFSATALSFYDEPTRTGYPSVFQFDSDGSAISDVLNMLDDDPLNAGSTYTSVASQVVTPGTAYNRGQGSFLVQNIYRMTKPTGRFVSWKVIGTSANNAFKVYGFLMAYVEKQ